MDNSTESKCLSRGAIELPVVTIAIPTYKRPSLLKQALLSAVSQKFAHVYEVVVVDNDAECSSSLMDVREVVELLMLPNVWYYKNSHNIGMFGNWNRCIELARGEYISILNDDDILCEYFLRDAFELLLSSKDATAVASNHRIAYDEHLDYSYVPRSSFIGRLHSFGYLNTGSIPLQTFLVNHRIHGTLGVLARRLSLVEAGGFDPSLYPVSDYEFWIRLLMVGNKIYWIEKPYCCYRVFVNESLKPGMRRDFVRHEHRIRLDVARRLCASSSIRILSNLSALISFVLVLRLKFEGKRGIFRASFLLLWFLWFFLCVLYIKAFQLALLFRQWQEEIRSY